MVNKHCYIPIKINQKKDVNTRVVLCVMARTIFSCRSQKKKKGLYSVPYTGTGPFIMIEHLAF